MSSYSATGGANSANSLSSVTIHGQGRIGAGQSDSKGKSDVSITIHVNRSDHPLTSTTVQTSSPAIEGAAHGVQQSLSPISGIDSAAASRLTNPAPEGVQRGSTPIAQEDFTKSGPMVKEVDVGLYKVQGASANIHVGQKSDVDAIRAALSQLAMCKWDANGLIMSTPEYTFLHAELGASMRANPAQYQLVRQAVYDKAHSEHHRFGDEKPTEPVPPAEPFEELQPVLHLQTESPARTAVVPTRRCNPCVMLIGAVVSAAGIAQLALASDNPDLEQDQWSEATQVVQFIAGGLLLGVGLGNLAFGYGKQPRD